MTLHNSILRIEKNVTYRSLSTLSPTRNLFYPNITDDYDELVAFSLTGLTAALPNDSENKNRWYDYGSNEKYNEFLFDKVNVPTSRFSDGTFPVWYGSTEKETTVCEQAWHKRKWTLFELQGTKEKYINFQMVFFKAIIDLPNCTDASQTYDSPLYHSDCYQKSNQFAKLVYKESIDGIKFLSRRLKNTTNWAVFNKENILESKAIAFWEMNITSEGYISYCINTPIDFDHEGWCLGFSI